MPKIKDEPTTTVPAASGGDVIYPDIQLHAAVGDDALDAEQAKELLGWETESDNIKFGPDYLVNDEDGKKVRCSKNLRNRPLNPGNVAALKQEILNRRWRFNGEPIIVGKTGTLLNGQHTLIALVLADQVRNGPQADHWNEVWKDEPIRIDKAVVFGVDEDDSVVNTMDTCKPRSLADVLYRCPYFADKKEGDRKKLATILDHAIRMLWSRTGAGADAFAPRRTHAESLAFIDDHPTLLKCVKHVYEEESNGSVSHFLSLGYMSALLYLMAASDASIDKYEAGGKVESAIGKLKQFNAACDFISLLAGGNTDVSAVRDAINALVDPETGVYTGSVAERVAILVKGWLAYSVNGKVTPKDVKLSYDKDEDGYRVLAEFPTVGGIDVGDESGAKSRADAAAEDDGSEEDDPAEIEARKAKIKKESLEATKEKDAPSPEEVLAQLRDEHPGYTLLFLPKNPKSAVNIFGADAEYVIRKWKTKPVLHEGIKVTTIPAQTLDERVKAMQADGRKVALVRATDDPAAPAVERLKSPAKPKK